MTFEVAGKEMATEVIDHQGLVAAVCRDLHIAERINERIGSKKPTVRWIFQLMQSIAMVKFYDNVGKASRLVVANLDSVRRKIIALIGDTACNIYGIQKKLRGNMRAMFQFSVNNRLFITAVFLTGSLNSMSLCSQEEIDQTENSSAGAIGDLCDAIVDFELDKVQQLIQAHPELVNARIEGVTPLHYAADCGNQASVELLLAHGARVGELDTTGQTPLHYATTSDIVKCLIEHGANVHAQDKFGKTPLHDASTSDATLCLIEHGADVHTQDKLGKTPLHYASTSDATLCLIEDGANVHAQDKLGKTPLHYAPTSDVALCLIQHGANVHAQTKTGITPLHYAATPGVLLCLLQHGANVRASDRIRILEILGFEHTITDINAKNKHGMAPLHRAANRGQIIVVACLLKLGADINVLTWNHHTPLYLACGMGHLETVKFLLTHGANIAIRPKGILAESILGRTLRNRHADVAAELIAQGANVEEFLNEIKTEHSPKFIAARKAQLCLIQANSILSEEMKLSKKLQEIIVEMVKQLETDEEVCQDVIWFMVKHIATLTKRKTTT